MSYNFNLKFQAGPFEVMVDTASQYGYFEHDDLGDECGGGLWFRDNNLIDYDGVFELPSKVSAGLREHGFIVDEEY